MKKLSLFAALPVAVLASASVSLAQHAHEHGSGKLNVAVDDAGLYIELEVTADDVVGFEYSPTTDAEREAITLAIADLTMPDLFSVDAAAGCVLEESEAEHEVEGEHAEFHVYHEFKCTAPGAIATLETLYFELFTGTEELEVQVSTDAGASAQEWESDQATLAL